MAKFFYFRISCAFIVKSNACFSATTNFLYVVTCNYSYKLQHIKNSSYQRDAALTAAWALVNPCHQQSTCSFVIDMLMWVGWLLSRRLPTKQLL